MKFNEFGRLKDKELADKLLCEDARKLHSEINSILGQRFTVTTAAVTAVGAATAWVVSTPVVAGDRAAPWLHLWGALGTYALMGVLFFWNRGLAYLQMNLAVYLVAKGLSQWEADWARFSVHKSVWSAGSIQTWIFLALGLLVAAAGSAYPASQIYSPCAVMLGFVFWLAYSGAILVLASKESRQHWRAKISARWAQILNRGGSPPRPEPDSKQ